MAPPCSALTLGRIEASLSATEPRTVRQVWRLVGFGAIGTIRQGLVVLIRSGHAARDEAYPPRYWSVTPGLRKAAEAYRRAGRL